MKILIDLTLWVIILQRVLSNSDTCDKENAVCFFYERNLDCKNLKDITSIHQCNKIYDNRHVDIKISDSSFVKLPANSFQNIRINRLEIHNTSLKTIDQDAFKGVKDLTSLLIINSYLTHFPKNIFIHTQNLAEINLENNYITEIQKDDFVLLNTNLLKRVILQGNQIRRVWENPLERFNLDMLDISENKLICDKHLAAFIFWIQTREPSIVGINKPNCFEPKHLQNAILTNLEKEDFINDVVTDAIEKIIPSVEVQNESNITGSAPSFTDEVTLLNSRTETTILTSNKITSQTSVDKITTILENNTFNNSTDGLKLTTPITNSKTNSLIVTSGANKVSQLNIRTSQHTGKIEETSTKENEMVNSFSQNDLLTTERENVSPKEITNNKKETTINEKQTDLDLQSTAIIELQDKKTTVEEFNNSIGIGEYTSNIIFKSTESGESIYTTLTIEPDSKITSYVSMKSSDEQNDHTNCTHKSELDSTEDFKETTQYYNITSETIPEITIENKINNTQQISDSTTIISDKNLKTVTVNRWSDPQVSTLRSSPGNLYTIHDLQTTANVNTNTASVLTSNWIFQPTNDNYITEKDSKITAITKVTDKNNENKETTKSIHITTNSNSTNTNFELLNQTNETLSRTETTSQDFTEKTEKEILSSTGRSVTNPMSNSFTSLQTFENIYSTKLFSDEINSTENTIIISKFTENAFISNKPEITKVTTLLTPEVLVDVTTTEKSMVTIWNIILIFGILILVVLVIILVIFLKSNIKIKQKDNISDTSHATTSTIVYIEEDCPYNPEKSEIGAWFYPHDLEKDALGSWHYPYNPNTSLVEEWFYPHDIKNINE